MQIEAQALPMIVHYHHAWLIWILFLAGDALHVSLQIDNLARTSKTTRRAVWSAVGTAVAFRTFAAAMIFGLIWEHPTLISQIAGLVGHPLGADEASVFAIPMNNMIAGLYGLFLDSLLGYIPILKSQLPSVEPKQP